MDKTERTNDIQSQMSDVLLNTFFINKKKYRVLLHFDTLVWEKENSKNDKTTVAVNDIITVQLTRSTSSSNNSCNNNNSNNSNRNSNNRGLSRQSNSMQSNTTGVGKEKQHFHVHYAKRIGSSRADCNRWRKCTIVLYNSDNSILKLWYDKLSKILNEQSRPKNILMFINPYGGRKQALNIYEKHSKPLLQLAGIEINCIISQRANQIHDIIMTQSLEPYDAICCIGGDGTFAEVFNGLIFRAIHDLKLDPVQPEYIPKPKLPIGVIPAGSTDTVAYCLHGTTDIKTAVIHIILGQTRGLDLCSVCNSNGLIRLYASVVSYGYLGDVALDSEKFRWMGPKRYDYSGFKKIITNRGYEGELMLLKSQEEEESPIANSTSSSSTSTSSSATPDEVKCYMNCERCLDVRTKIDSGVLSTHSNMNGDQIDYVIMTSPYQNNNSNTSGADGKWKNVKGKFFMISGANVSCACSKVPNGFAPYCHVGDGYIDIIVIRHTTFINNIRLLLNLVKSNSNIRHLPFVEVHRTKKFYFRAPRVSSDDSINGSCQPISIAGSKTSQWNCDGEVIHDPDILISSHCQLVNVFMRGSYPVSDVKNSSRCGCCF